MSCSIKLRKLVTSLQSKRCWYCGMYEPLEMHRLIPGREGGKYVLGNVIGLGSECHKLCEGLNAQQLYNLVPYGLEVGTVLSKKYFESNKL